MNNTTISAIAAVLMAATLVLGGTLAATSAQSAFAYQKKKGGDEKNGNTVTVQASKQKESVSGWDNTAEQEAENVICTHPGNNASCVSEGSEGAAAGGGGGGGGGGGTASCTVGVSATLVSTGAAVCVTLGSTITSPPCTAPLVAVQIDGINVCATIVV
jgi:hypothetical protein